MLLAKSRGDDSELLTQIYVQNNVSSAWFQSRTRNLEAFTRDASVDVLFALNFEEINPSESSENTTIKFTAFSFVVVFHSTKR